MSQTPTLDARLKEAMGPRGPVRTPGDRVPSGRREGVLGAIRARRTRRLRTAGGAATIAIALAIGLPQVFASPAGSPPVATQPEVAAPASHAAFSAHAPGAGAKGGTGSFGPGPAASPAPATSTSSGPRATCARPGAQAVRCGAVMTFSGAPTRAALQQGFAAQQTARSAGALVVPLGDTITVTLPPGSWGAALVVAQARGRASLGPAPVVTQADPLLVARHGFRLLAVRPGSALVTTNRLHGGQVWGLQLVVHRP